MMHAGYLAMINKVGYIMHEKFAELKYVGLTSMLEASHAITQEKHLYYSLCCINLNLWTLMK